MLERLEDMFENLPQHSHECILTLFVLIPD